MRTIIDVPEQALKSLDRRIPDAIIWASAQTSNTLLVTRNIRDFPAEDPGIRIPYAL